MASKEGDLTQEWRKYQQHHLHQQQQGQQQSSHQLQQLKGLDMSKKQQNPITFTKETV